MSKIAIVTDSGVNLSPRLRDQYGIRVVPLTYHQKGILYSDAWSVPDFSLEKTAPITYLPPTVTTFTLLYRELMAEGFEAIISIHSSARLIRISQVALQASRLVPIQVYVIDSETVDVGLGHQVQLAAQLAEQGRSAQEILASLEQVKQKSQSYFLLTSIKNHNFQPSLTKKLLPEKSILDSRILLKLAKNKLSLLIRNRSLKKIKQWLKTRWQTLEDRHPDHSLLAYSNEEEWKKRFVLDKALFTDKNQDILPASPLLRMIMGQKGIFIYQPALRIE